jgi:hypothetical protein
LNTRYKEAKSFGSDAAFGFLILMVISWIRYKLSFVTSGKEKINASSFRVIATKK